MSVEVFELYIQHSLKKLENLWLRAKEISAPGVKTPKTKERIASQQQQILQESLTQLSGSIEEMRVVTETLRQQNDELIASRQLLEAEKRYYQELFQYSPDCCLITSIRGTVVEVNQKAVELLNIPAKYLINKSLAVFISLPHRQKYYTLLNQLKFAEISVANWDFDLMPRDRQQVSVNCVVVAVKDSKQKIVNLRWQISGVGELQAKSGNSQSSLVSVDSLRSPLYNLKVQLVEIAQNTFPRLIFDPRLLQARTSLQSIINRVDRAYVLEQYREPSQLNLSLIDYAVSCQQVVRQLACKPKVYVRAQTPCSGICDVFLFEQLIGNLLERIIIYSVALNRIEVMLNKIGNRLEITIHSFEIITSATIPTAFNLSSRVGDRYGTATNDWQLAVIQKCLMLLEGEILLDSGSRNPVTVTFPAIANLMTEK